MRGIISIALSALAAAACNADQAASVNQANSAEAIAAARATAAEGKPVELKSETPLMNWEVSWPAEVNAIPKLEQSIRDPAEKDLAELTTQARQDKADRAERGFDFNPYDYSVTVEVAGQTPRLLSLTRGWMNYTGGAHPNHGTGAILWDKAAEAKVDLASLLGSGGSLDRLYRAAFCKELDAERAKKREGVDATNDPDDPFSQCPKLNELAIIPLGPPKGGSMMSLLFHADPYVAGPYVEGDYDIELPVTAAFIAALKPQYRASFAIRR